MRPSARGLPDRVVAAATARSDGRGRHGPIGWPGVGDNACARALASSGDQSHRRPGKATSLGRRRVRPRGNACARASTHACGRQRLCLCDDGCRTGGVFFHQHPKLQRSSDDVCVRATMPASGRRHTHASGRQRLRLCDDGCHVGGVFFHQHPKLQRSDDDVCVRATTLAHGRQRPCLRDDVWILFGIFFGFRNPNKTFPLSLLKNYSNCVEDGNPKLFLLVRVFLSALNCDLAFLSRHLSI